MCVRNVDVHVSCSSHVNAQLAAFFIDPRAKGSTEMVCIFAYSTPLFRPTERRENLRARARATEEDTLMRYIEFRGTKAPL